MKKNNKISEAELEIMKVIWEAGEPVSSTDIVRRLKDKCGWEDTTIYTMLSKLVKKGVLIRDKKVVSYYSASLTEQDYMLEQTESLVDRLFAGDSRQLVSMLVENRKTAMASQKVKRTADTGSVSGKGGEESNAAGTAADSVSGFWAASFTDPEAFSGNALETALLNTWSEGRAAEAVSSVNADSADNCRMAADGSASRLPTRFCRGAKGSSIRRATMHQM